MADWRQIQARIRKAKASTDAAAKLAELYERTRDAMVAFELARWQEKAGEHAEAARWYTAAAERFRRSQWKSKAEAALARLRAPADSPATLAEETAEADDVDAADSSPVASPAAPSDFESSQRGRSKRDSHRENEIIAGNESSQTEALEESSREPAGDLATVAETSAAEDQSGETLRKKPRRRGRRGGRNRRRGTKRLPSAAAAASPQPETQAATIESPPEKPARPSLKTASVPEAAAAEAPTGASATPSAWRGRGRAGEPALASRMAHLESQLRRLLASPQAKLEQAESAPAGPGVLLLSDSEQVTHYYIESCQTLRIAIGNLLRGGRGAKDLPQLRERLAGNLGVAESRVNNYLKEHCAVRWLQLDEGASELAHFAIAVLRPVVNV